MDILQRRGREAKPLLFQTIKTVIVDNQPLSVVSELFDYVCEAMG